jgi:hypothetical protein
MNAMTQAFEDGYAFAQEMHRKYGYSAEHIRDAATAYCRDMYERRDEREDYDNGVSAYLWGAWGDHTLGTK